MKLYSIKSEIDVSGANDGTRWDQFEEFVTSSGAAGAARARLKKLGHIIKSSTEVEMDISKAGFVKFLNDRSAHPTWVVAPVTEKLGG